MAYKILGADMKLTMIKMFFVRLMQILWVIAILSIIVKIFDGLSMEELFSACIIGGAFLLIIQYLFLGILNPIKIFIKDNHDDEQ